MAGGPTGSKAPRRTVDPRKLDEIRIPDVYDNTGLLRGDFRDCFAQENGCAQINKIHWLSGDKRYGSMAVYLSRGVDAQNLLRRRIVHIRGEAVFAEAYLYRNRPLCCRNCQVYGHKQQVVGMRLHVNAVRNHTRQLNALPPSSDARHTILRTCSIVSGMSMIRVNRNIPSVQQIEITFTDITAVLLPTEKPILAVSAYVPPIAHVEEMEALFERLTLISKAISRLKERHRAALEVIVTGGFNRHHLFWGDNEVIRQRKRQDEADPIIHFRETSDCRAAKYLSNQSGATTVPTLRTSDKLVERDEEKAQVLLSSFFPPLPPIQEEQRTTVGRPSPPLPFEPLTHEEVKTAVRCAQSWRREDKTGFRWEYGKRRLPQGSPMSPILFLFMNAKLVKVRITDKKGAIVFVDDYTHWVVGPSADANTVRLQEKIIPRALQWTRESGALFEPEKTSFIYFKRNSRVRQQPAVPLWVEGTTLPAQLLGVVLDQELRLRLHAPMAAKKGNPSSIRLKGLTPEAARQLFTSTVTATVDWNLMPNEYVF
ncbi:hypothetical protein CNMCM8980_004878 [Aspergillus fumigatiaffinis]|nr:hypothetical protein CNMCM8980_004878 [Aspergillus fumigatiaffinis]